MKKILKKILQAVIISLLITAMLASSASAQGSIVKVTANDGLELRTGPGAQYDIVKVLANGSRWYTYGSSDNWMKLGTNQWIDSKYTEVSSPIKKVTVTASSGLNVRLGPGTKNKIIKVLPFGTDVDVLEEKDSWYRIDNTGWISSHYTKLYTAKSKIAYLTFDDGPSTKNTPKILDILKEYGIKATFFVNGYGSKDLYKRIVAEGHVIGNHTYSHDYKTVYSSVSNFKKDVEKLSDYLEEITGKRPDILRFPGGSNNTVSRKYGGTKIMKTLCSVVHDDMGYQYFDWNVSSEDASTYRAKKDFIVNAALKGAKSTNRAIVLMHDAAPKTTTVEALPEIIDGLIDMGFKFEVLTKDTPSVQFIKP